MVPAPQTVRIVTQVTRTAETSLRVAIASDVCQAGACAYQLKGGSSYSGTLQGLDIMGGSPMSGNSTWAIVGPVVAAVGMLVFLYGLRLGRRE